MQPQQWAKFDTPLTHSTLRTDVVPLTERNLHHLLGNRLLLQVFTKLETITWNYRTHIVTSLLESKEGNSPPKRDVSGPLLRTDHHGRLREDRRFLQSV